MKNMTWRKITAIATIMGMLIPNIPVNSIADEMSISEETEYYAKEEFSETEEFYSEDEIIVQESNDEITSIDDGIIVDETEAMIEEELRASDSDADEESSGEKTVIGSITIGYICRVLSDETTANPTNVAETCTFTLYREDGVTPISTRQLTISTYNYKSSSSVTFDNLNEGVY